MASNRVRAASLKAHDTPSSLLPTQNDPAHAVANAEIGKYCQKAFYCTVQP